MTQASPHIADDNVVQLHQPEPAISEETRLLELEALSTERKRSIAEAAQAALRDATDINNRRQSLDFRLGEAERRLDIVAGSAAKYRDGMRGEAISRMLMGEAVDLEAVEVENPIDQLSASDLKQGIQALREQRKELSRRWEATKALVAKLERDYMRQHALVHGARYQRARRMIEAAWIELVAAESNLAKFAPFPGIAQLVRMEQMTPLHVPAVDSELTELRPVGVAIGGREVSGERIMATHIVRNHAEMISAEFKNGGV